MLTPAYRIVVDGTEITNRINRRLVQLSLTAKRGEEADELELVISNSDRQMRRPDRGAMITLSLGWQRQALKDMGAFKVDETEWSNSPAQIRIRARSADFTAGMRIRRERSWRNTTLGAVLGDIAAAGGLAANIAPAMASKPVTLVTQSRESDLALLRRLGRDYDAVATVKAGKLLFAPVGSGMSASGRALPTLTILESDGDKITVRSASRNDYKGVTASWHDGGPAERKTVTVGDEEGARKLKTVYSTEASARQAAEAEWSRIQRGAHEMSITLARGRADIFPECRFRIPIDEPSIAGVTWLVKDATHNLSKGAGWTTSIQAETAP
jgi:hypothetical protein